MDGWMDGRLDRCCVNKGGRGCGGGRSASPTMRTKYRQHLGKHRVVWFWLLVCWLLGGLPMLSKYRQHLGKTFGCLVCLLLVGYPPFLFYSPSFGWLAWPRCCLVGWSVGWHSVDGWMHACMDGWILCCLTFRRRPGQFPAFPVVPDSLCAVSGGEGLVTRSY